jgi:hypothetical protein
MYAGMLFALELHKARHNDLLRQAAEYRLGRLSRRESAGHAQVLEPLHRAVEETGGPLARDRA